MRNSALDYIRGDEFKRSRYKFLAWPMLFFGLVFFWEFEEGER